MRKQLLKGFAMLMAIMALAMVTAVASVNGQTLSVRANVPFEFIVGSQSLPAGAYEVRTITNSGDTLKVAGRNNTKDLALRITIPASGKAKGAMLVFHRYGERYFLAQVWSTAQSGRELVKSKQERAIQKELSTIAAIHGDKPGQCGCEIVEIAVAQQ